MLFRIYTDEMNWSATKAVGKTIYKHNVRINMKHIPGTRLTQAASCSLTKLSANFFPAER